MQRFFVTFPLSIDLVLTDPDIVHQLTRVMRVVIGDRVVLFDGDGSETTYEIMTLTKKSLSLRGQERVFPKTESEKKITLYQALPNKIEKIEYILQKGVEVGIGKFVFFRSDFSQKLVLSDTKKVRLRAIAREAVEQCGGVVMPEISYQEAMIGDQDFCVSVIPGLSRDPGRKHRFLHTPQECFQAPFQSARGAQEGQPQNIVLDTTGKSQKFSEISESHEMSLWVGPEGGWSEKEREKMRDYGFLFVRFGERVLRTETAGVVTAFALLHS